MHRLLPLSFLVVLPLGTAIPLAGCDQLQDALSNLKVPTGDLSRVDLVQNPTVNQLAGWGCHEFLGGNYCSFLGVNKPSKPDMRFSFDLVFGLHNPNASVPIPLVELLLGFTVFDGANLGSACLSFCDPDDESCVPTTNALGACEVKQSDPVQQAGDLIPSVDDLFDLAEDLAADGAIDNGDFRVLPGGGDVEAHIQFDLGIDVMLDLADEILGDAVDDLLASRNIVIDIPYSATGSLFFEAPALGRKAVGFGPLESVWTLQ
jgi:hypothetical protein